MGLGSLTSRDKLYSLHGTPPTHAKSDPGADLQSCGIHRGAAANAQGGITGIEQRGADSVGSALFS